VAALITSSFSRGESPGRVEPVDRLDALFSESDLAVEAQIVDHRTAGRRRSWM
jgi:hypothetical protein